jgi:threonine/homoserine/homoserine lactone efflux protein
MDVSLPCCLSGTQGKLGKEEKKKKKKRKEENDKHDWLEILANKVPVEIAGPVIIALYFINQLPFILEKIQGPAQTQVLEIVIGALVFAIVFSMCLYAVARFRNALRRPRSKAN